MAGGWAAAITAVFSVIALLLEAWAQNAPQRKKEDRDEAIQNGRVDIADGDAQSVSARVDRVLTETTGDPARLGSDEDTARRLAEITGG